MNAIAKVLAPAALVLASFSASAAGLVETDYPFEQPAATQAATAAPGAGPSFSGLDIHYPGAVATSDRGGSSQDMKREMSGTGFTTPFGPDINA